MSLHDLFEDLYRHLEWADAEVWRAVLASEAAAEDGALRDRLHHTHLVQRAFLHLWDDLPVDVEAGAGLRGVELMAWARGFYGPARERLDALSEEGFARPIAMPWAAEVSQRLGIEPATTTLRDTFLQVHSHSQHHRGQICLRLRELGETPPLLDFIAWVWRGRPSAEWP